MTTKDDPLPKIPVQFVLIVWFTITITLILHSTVRQYFDLEEQELLYTIIIISVTISALLVFILTKIYYRLLQSYLKRRAEREKLKLGRL